MDGKLCNFTAAVAAFRALSLGSQMGIPRGVTLWYLQTALLEPLLVKHSMDLVNRLFVYCYNNKTSRASDSSVQTNFHLHTNSTAGNTIDRK